MKNNEAQLTRRTFLAAAAGTVLSGQANAQTGNAARSAKTIEGANPTGDDATFVIPLLGDLHFDRLTHHDMDWVRQDKPNDVHQIENYSRITQGVMPALFRQVRQQVAQAKSKVPFVLHIGDLVEGLCGNGGRSEQQNHEALAFVREARLNAPFLFAKGNHDVTGPGAPEAFDKVFLPFLTEQTKQDVRSANYTYTHGETLFAFFDAYTKNSLEWLEKTLAARTARQFVLVIHPPVVPYDARSLWHIYARPAEQEQRTKLLNLLGRHHAVVLCGHLHKYGTVVRKTEGGAFVQVATCSVIPSLTARPTQETSGLENYGPDLVKMEPNFEPKNEADRRAALVAEKPFLRYFEYADAPGYAMLNVHGKGIGIDLYSGVENKIWRSLPLTDLLAHA
ncbi:MAG: 3,5-cyclic adenosine monophosphate phosphodiesterase CpdA [Chthonomonadaceae bacterium]|nr:3,5-cyclic adenosine monophosphate phosphodiesterase CpdA [Chthonomonadaceae bacterium]